MGAFDVTRKVALEPGQEARLEEAVRHLKGFEPILSVRVSGRNSLRITYDAACIGIGDIGQMLDAAGFTRSGGLAWKLRSAWYAFLDANARSSSMPGGACCNRPPPGATGRKR